MRIRPLLTALLLGVVLPLHAATPRPTLSGAWIRLLPGDLPAGGYFTLHNDSDQTLTLIGARSPAYGMVMLHQSLQSQGESRMVMVDKVDIPPHSRLRFAPGGYHLMLMKPAQPLKIGETIPVTLRFDGGATLSGQFKVRGAAALGP